VSLAMTVEEREAFLAGLHVGVLSVADGARAPLTIPIWYAYEPGGEVSFITGGESRKMQLLRAAGRCSLCVQSENPPYKYVTVEGPVTAIVGPPVEEPERRAMAYRYLGASRGDAYLAATTDLAAHEVVVRVRPERWLTADYGKLSA
jgi:PPOX class probable F420-dependent enzyme